MLMHVTCDYVQNRFIYQSLWASTSYYSSVCEPELLLCLFQKNCLEIINLFIYNGYCFKLMIDPPNMQ